LLYGVLPFVPAFNLEHIRSYVFLLMGTFLLLRRWRSSREAAVFGALIFTFSSFNFAHFMHMNFVAIVAHLPWVLLAVDHLLKSRAPHRTALAWLAISLLTASQLLHAHPQMTWMSLLVTALYAGLVLAPLLRRGSMDGGPRMAAWRATALLSALVVGFASAGVQLLPMWETLQTSSRSDPSELFIDFQTLRPLLLVQLVSPYLMVRKVMFPEFALYCSAAVPPLIVWLLLRRRDVGDGWSIARAALGLAVIGVLLTMGDAGLLHRGVEQLPLVGLFRSPVRYILLVEIGLCVASAIAFSDLLRVAREGGAADGVRLWPLALPTLLAVAAGLAFVMTPVGDRPPWLERTSLGSAVAVGSALTALCGGLVWIAARGQSAACAALVALAAVDLGAYGLREVRDPGAVRLDAWLDAASIPLHPQGTRLRKGDYRLTLNGVRFASGYVAMFPNRTLPIYASGRPKGMTAAAYDHAMQVSSVSRRGKRHAGLALPRARMLAQALATDDLPTALGEIDPARTALVSAPLSLESGPRGEATLVRDDPGEIHIETRAPTRQLLVLSESHHPGWRARVDGEPCHVVRVYGDYMGCVVPAGEHEVAFTFAPDSHRHGMTISWIGLGLTAIGPATYLALRARATTPASETPLG
jgi:hypothetical protein